MNNKTIIYIRHGQDKRSGYKYDEKLTSRGKKESKEMAIDLIKQYGLPDVIYCSPFYRTRQTKRRMVKMVKKYGGDPKVIIDSRLSRFFTKKEKRNPDIKKDTMKHNVPIYESWEEFKLRVKDQLNDMESSNNQIVWCIGHTLIIKHVARFKNIDRPDHVDYLDTVIITLN